MEVLTIRTVTAQGEQLEHFPTHTINSIVIDQDEKGIKRVIINTDSRVILVRDEHDAMKLAKRFEADIVNEREAKNREVAFAEVRAKVAAQKEEQLRIKEAAQKEREAIESKRAAALEKHHDMREKAAEAAIKRVEALRKESDKLKVNAASEKVKAKIKEVDESLAKEVKAKKTAKKK